ncbi:hypothetical protein [Nostoc sp.]|uniref:hypothetical protein n=1 Tax=Nostoc sp. TaxID=1180 RepID=UPI00359305EE
MNIKELLLQEIESSSDILLTQTLDFLRFLKTKPGTEEISLDLSTEKNDDTSSHKTKPEIQEATPILRGCLKSPQACVSLPWLPRNCYERIGVLGFEIALLSRT